MKRITSWAMALALVWCLTAGGAQAAEMSKGSGADSELAGVGSIGASTTKGPFYSLSENELRGRKLARGIANITLCVTEIPNQMFQEAYNTSPVTGCIVGFGKGIWKGGKRLMIGTWETVTFYHPGSNYYQPYVQPEVVMQEYLH